MAHTNREPVSGSPRPAVRPADGAAARRPDASMSLLLEAMERPLDPGYAAAAAARDGTAGRTPARTAVVVLVALLCGAGATTAVLDLRRPTDRDEVRTALLDRIQTRNEETSARQRANRTLQLLIEKAQARALSSDSQAAITQKTSQLAFAAGETPVTGPGLELVIADAATSEEPAVGTDPREDEAADQGKVLDKDLQLVVNGLWAAGAEAIAINGHRLTAVSAIRSAGQAILVDYRPLVPPYVVDAVGDPNRLQTGFADGMAGPYLQSLRDNYGVQAGISAKQALTLPAAPLMRLRAAAVPSTPAATGTRTPATPGTTSEVRP